MRTKTRPVCLKLTPTELQAIEDLVCLGKYPSISSAIRAGIGMLFEHHGLNSEADRRIESERRIHRPRAGKVVRPRDPATMCVGQAAPAVYPPR